MASGILLFVRPIVVNCVTEGTAMAPWNGPNKSNYSTCLQSHTDNVVVVVVVVVDIDAQAVRNSTASDIW